VSGGKRSRKAVQVCRDKRLERLTANDVIGHFLKRRELVDLEQRIQRIEERLETRG